VDAEAANTNTTPTNTGEVATSTSSEQETTVKVTFFAKDELVSKSTNQLQDLLKKYKQLKECVGS
jgi:uncharacterized protein YktA (UPF0223 family)